MRDQFNLSGDFRGALININSSLDRARQCVDAAASEEFADIRAKLDGLLDKLREELSAVGPEHHEAAEALAESTAVVVETATSARSNPTSIQAGVQRVLNRGKSLLKASPAIASTVNTILEIVEKVAATMGK